MMSCFVVRETVFHWNIADYRRLYPNTVYARRFGAMVIVGQNSKMSDRMGVRRDTDTGAWNQRWASAGEHCAGIMDPVGRFNMPFARHANEVTYTCALCWILSETKDNQRAMRKYELGDWTKQYGGFCLVKDANDRTCELVFEWRQRTITKRCQFIGWHNLKGFALSGRERSVLYAVAPES